MGIDLCWAVHEVSIRNALECALDLIIDTNALVRSDMSLLVAHATSAKEAAPSKRTAVQLFALAVEQHCSSPAADAMRKDARHRNVSEIFALALMSAVPVDPATASLDADECFTALRYAVATHSCVAQLLPAALAAQCNVTVQHDAVREHVDKNHSPEGFLEGLCSIYVARIPTRQSIVRISPKEGALYMPRSNVAVKRRPCFSLHVVYFDAEPHLVVSPPGAYARHLRGVGGDADYSVGTIADWTKHS